MNMKTQPRYTFAKGDGAHGNSQTDSWPVTVVDVSPSGHAIKVQAARQIKTPNAPAGLPPEYTFEECPWGEIETFTLRASGYYVLQGQPGRYGFTLLPGYAYRRTMEF